MKHCDSCTCYAAKKVEAARVGDTLRNRVTDEVGVVKALTEENLPWSYEKIPMVWVDGNFAGYWQYYDVIERA